MISERIEQVAADAPDVLAIIDGTDAISYSDLVKRKRAFAQVLRNRFGLREGEIVVTFLPNCWEFAVSFLAAAEIGAIFLPVNTQWRGPELGWLVRRFPVRLVVTCREYRAVWNEIQETLPPERILEVDADEPVMAWSTREPESTFGCGRRRYDAEPVLYLATSGSTGRPKLAPRSHRNLLTGARAVGEALGVVRGQRFLGVVPFYHANGFSNCLFLPLMSGATVIPVRKFLPSVLAGTAESQKAEVLIGSPVLFRLLADGVTGQDSFRSVRMCLSSGARMPKALAQRCEEQFGLRVRELYGSSETGTVSIATGDGACEPGSAGKLLPAVEIRTLDEDGTPLPSGSTGEIAVRSPAMMSGYVDEPDLNRAVLRDGFFRTGDLGRLTAERTLIIEGRRKRLVNSGGVKVDPMEVEDVIRSHPSVRDCRVCPDYGAGKMEVLKANVAVRPGCSITRREMIEHCRRKLSEYKIPKVIEFVTEIRTDLTGKRPVEWSRS